MVNFVQIGGLRIALPALLVAAVGIAASLVLTLVAPKFWVAWVVLLGMTFLASYNINCNIVGHCVVFAWIMAGILLFELVTLAIMAITAKPVVNAFVGKRGMP